LQFSGGADYQIISQDKGNDSDILSYNVSASFFPGMKFSWNLFSRNTTSAVETSANLAGYDINTTSYGGALQMHLGSKGRNGNNRNNNNRNNQANNTGLSLPLPDVILSYTSTEVESLSTINPLHETREDSKGSLAFGGNSSFSLNLDGGLEKYNNLQDGRSYDMTTANLALKSRVAGDADLSVSGQVSNRDTSNFLNFDTRDDVYSYMALLNFKEKQGWSQYYKYSVSARKNSLFDYSDQNADARVRYRLTPEWFLEGGLTYRVADYIQFATALVPEAESSLNSGGIVAGAAYAKTYTPAFLGPFSFTTNYDFTEGRSSYSTTAAASEDGGRGSYYKNTVALGLASTGWVKEQVGLSYRYNSRRDRSPLDYDLREDSLSLTLSTRRIPKVGIQGVASYNVTDTRNAAGSSFLNTPVSTSGVDSGVTQERRYFNYNATIDYYLAQYLTLAAGATRGQSVTDTFTLATLPSPVRSDDFNAFGTAVFNYSITRNLSYRMDYREEYRSTIQTDTRSHQAGAYINYRLRQILVGLEYRIRQDIPENNLRTQQQYYYARLSRPF
jgi:hypothetical protein